jgi:hypothetical protein
MTLSFRLCMLFTGAFLVVSPIIYKTVVIITLSIVVVKEHRADLNVGAVEPYLVFSLFTGLTMMAIAVVSSFRSKNKNVIHE